MEVQQHGVMSPQGGGGQAKGVNLAMLIDFMLQKTYHDLNILSELLPRKSDIERKIEIIKFSTKAHQLFVRLLALVKWAASADGVDKCQSISSFLDEKNAYFIDTADSLARIARETLVQACLPNFSLPTAIDVLTTGKFNRLPKCIKTKIVPNEPVNPEDKLNTFKRLNEVIQHRLCVSTVPKYFNSIKIGEGRVKLRVDHEFEVTLMLMGVGKDIPWRLLSLDFLIQDHELGGGKDLVHGMQVHYIHQIVQSRLIVESEPLVDLYNSLHFFCLSLQLEIYHTQSQRFIGERWGDCVRVDNYLPGKELVLSYCRTTQANFPRVKDAVYPRIIIKASEDQLILQHDPCFYVNSENVAGKSLPTQCRSIELVYLSMSKQYARMRLRDMKTRLEEDAFFAGTTCIDQSVPSLRVTPYPDCSPDEHFLIVLDRKTGLYTITNKIKCIQAHKLQALLCTDIVKFREAFHKFRLLLYLERCKNSVLSLPLQVYTSLPLHNPTSLPPLPAHKLIFKFKTYTSFALVLGIDMSEGNKEIVERCYLLTFSPLQSERDCHVVRTVQYCRQINFHKILKQQTQKASVSPPKKARMEEVFYSRPLYWLLSQTIRRVPFIELSKHLSTNNVKFDGVVEDSEEHLSLNIAHLPCNSHAMESETFHNHLLSCTLHLDQNKWSLVYRMQSFQGLTTCEQHVVFTYHEEQAQAVVHSILKQHQCLLNVLTQALNVPNVFKSLKEKYDITHFNLESYNFKELVISYSANKSFNLRLWYDTRFELQFTKNGRSREACPHHFIEDQLAHEFNQHQNLQLTLKTIHDTLKPLQAITSILILPAIGVSSKVLSVMKNFTFITHSSTLMKLIYRNQYILEVYFLYNSVLIRDGTLYRTDSTKAMRGFTTIPQLTSFLQLFMEKGNNIHVGGDYPFTPGVLEYDQPQNEHFVPTSHGASSAYKDRPTKSPAMPSPYNATQSPLNLYSTPSPGTFIQRSPANLPAMSPSAWPGSPPVVQGSPHSSRNNPSRQLLSSINVSHTPVPIVLSYAGFHRLLLCADGKPCALERFFGSILLRNHLIRVVRIDDTLQLEKFENGVVIFSGVGKNGVDTGLQYSVRLNPQSMDALVLKITPSKDAENLPKAEELKVLEQFFENKVVCAPYKVSSLTGFARILGAQPKCMRDFIKIMSLESQTNWSGFNFRFELCLTVPPSDLPSTVPPGTPAVFRKAKNLIFLQLTEVTNPSHTFTVSIVHDTQTNAVKHFEFPKPDTPLLVEPAKWAQRATSSVKVLLENIAAKISTKELPISCTIYAIIKNMRVPPE